VTVIERPTKAIIAVAGYGTRRLPVAKAVDKCMIPLLNRPVVDYAVEDVIAAGVTDIYFVVSGDARQIRDYYSRNVELEEYLDVKGGADLIPLVTPPKGVRFHYVEQDVAGGQYGTAVPVWLAGQFIEPEEHFYLIMGDQALWREDGESEAGRLYRSVAADTQAVGAVTVVPIAEEVVERYGVVRSDEDGYYRDIVEKPKQSEAPSLLNNASFFLLPGTIMSYVDRIIDEHHTSEYHITDVLNQFAADGNRITVYKSDAAYLDCGTVESWVASNSFLLNSIGT
jgi:UTP--glucose-1-phosphate uridylyltransferase